MRRWVSIMIAAVVLCTFLGTGVFLWTRAQVPDVEVTVEAAERRDIVVKTVATGAVKPRHEVAIKPAVSGVVASLAVDPGDIVSRGDLIATIRILPDAASLARAEAELDRARLRRGEVEEQLVRVKRLHDQQAASLAELESAQVAHSVAEQAVEAAARLLRIVREGAAGGVQVATEVRSTVAGMVLDVTVEEGTSVIEANNFNAGTTVAMVADMDDLVFEGLVDESEVTRIAEDMAIEITIGAMRERRFAGALEYIAPKGVDNAGTVQFEIRAALGLDDATFVRAGLSANADIVLDRRDGVLAVREALVTYSEGAPTVQKRLTSGAIEVHEVALGISDGIWTEVLEGVAPGDELVVPAD